MAVIEALDVFKDTLSSMEAGWIFLMKYQLLLQAGKETFTRGKVILGGEYVNWEAVTAKGYGLSFRRIVTFLQR